jgi:hypothetical protein
MIDRRREVVRDCIRSSKGTILKVLLNRQAIAGADQNRPATGGSAGAKITG